MAAVLCIRDDQTPPEGQNPFDISLYDIINDFPDDLNELPMFREIKEEIDKKYEIQMDVNDCWPEDVIARVWGETKKMDQDLELLKNLLIVMAEVVKCMGTLCRKTYARAEKDKINPEEDEREEENAGEEKIIGRKFYSLSDDKPEKVKKKESVYIRVPFTQRFGNQPNLRSELVTENIDSEYKLTNADPLEYTDNPNGKLVTTTEPYVLLYDKQTCNPVWSYEIFNQDTLESNVSTSFKVDPNLPVEYQTPESLRPYQTPNDSYNRGHLAAAGNYNLCIEDKKRTYLLSNISPQYKTLNNGAWNILENECRLLTRAARVRNVHLYSGPLYLPDNSNQDRIGGKAVPSHFFKVIIAEYEDGSVKFECYKMSNISDYRVEFVDIGVIERESGVKFTERRVVEANDITWNVTFDDTNCYNEMFRPDMSGQIVSD